MTTLELRIVPDIDGGDAVASLERVLLASKGASTIAGVPSGYLPTTAPQPANCGPSSQ